jgi:uncharacterized RDD family membrane protein YckC
LRCFALNPQNVEAPPDETTPDGKPVPKAVPRSGAKASPKSGQRPAVGARPASAPALPSLSIDSDGPAPKPLSMSLESDPPAPVRLDFSSDPAPAADARFGEPPSLGLDQIGGGIPAALRSPFGSVPRVGGSRPKIPALGATPVFKAEPEPPKAAFEEIPAAEISSDEIEAMLAAKKTTAKKPRKAKTQPVIDPSEQPTEPPTAPPPPTEESEVDRLRAALDDAALDHAWGQAQKAPEGTGPFDSPAPPVQAPVEEDLSGIVAADDAPPRKLEGEEDLSGIVAADDAPPRKLEEEEDLSGIVAADDAPPRKLEEEEDLSGIVAADDAAPRKVEEEDEAPLSPEELAAMLGKKPKAATKPALVAEPPAPLPEPAPEDDVPFAPPISSLPPKPEIHLTPFLPDPEPALPLPPPPPARTTPRARLTAWTFDASLLFTAGAGFVGITAAVLGRPRLAPLGYQSPDSWADQLLFGRNLPVFWCLLLLTLGVAYSWLFAALGGRTPGMQLAGLRLRKLDGGLPGPALGLAHALLALPSLLGLFGFLSALFDPKCQTLHDKLLGLVVEPDE